LSGDDSLIPVSDEQAKLGQKALEVLSEFGGFLRQVLGTVPEDLVGLCGGDWLKVRRAQNFAAMLNKSRDHLRKRGVREPQPANLKVALPIFEAAANEGREELQDIWARLLATAADPKRAGQVRSEFIEIARQMEPLDATVLLEMQKRVRPSPTVREHFAKSLGKPIDEVELSLSNLYQLGLTLDTNVTPLSTAPSIFTVKGREFMRAVND